MKAAFVIVALLMLGGVARADSVDDLVAELTTSARSKDRLRAAASLAATEDSRAITAFIAVLIGAHQDDDKNVRAAAALGLGKVVTSATSTDDKKRAMAALKLAANDEDRSVRRRAMKALAILEKLDDLRAGAVYVELGSMVSNVASTTPSDADLTAAMQKSLEKSFQRDAKDWLTALPADVDMATVQGYYVDGSVDEVLMRQRSSGYEVRCKVRLQLASYPAKGMLAQVVAAASVTFDPLSDLAGATYDCVDAVIGDVVAKKLIPGIESGQITSTSGSGSSSGTGWAKPASVSASVTAPIAESAWSTDGWTLLGEDEVDLIDEELEVDRRKSTWSEVAIVVTGDAVQLDAVELGFAGKGKKKRHHAELEQTLSTESEPRIIELNGKRRTIDKVRLTYTKHRLDAQTRVQVWAR